MEKRNTNKQARLDLFLIFVRLFDLRLFGFVCFLFLFMS